MRTLKELAQLALDCQDMSNLSGLAISFGKLMEGEMRAAMEAKGLSTDTTAVNRHPIVKLIICKLYDLSGIGIVDMDVYDRITKECEAIAQAD